VCVCERERERERERESMQTHTHTGASSPGHHFMDSMLESPTSSERMRVNAFALSSIKQQLTEAEIEGAGVFGKRPSSSGFGYFKMRHNLTIEVDAAMSDASKENAGDQPLRQGLVVCSPHDYDMTPGVLVWGNPNEGVSGEPSLLQRRLSRSRSPTQTGSLSPPLRPFSQGSTGRNSHETLRVYTPTPENDLEDDDTFIRTPPLTNGWNIASANSDVDDVEMCSTPVGQVHRGDLFESSRPPSGGLAPGKARQPQKMVRSASLFDAKDYTDLLRPQRLASQLLYDNHYECISLEGRGDFGEVWLALHHATRQRYAVKRSTETFRGSRDRQVQLLKFLKSPLCTNSTL
jgi:hypothetical protein